MKRFLLSLSLAFSAILAGCAGGFAGTGIGQTAPQAVFAAKGTYSTALSAAVAYRRLPACSATVTQPCRDAAVLEQLRKADTAAVAALDAAETMVMAACYDAQRVPFKDGCLATSRVKIDAATASAAAATRAFLSITTTLGVKQ